MNKDKMSPNKVKLLFLVETVDQAYQDAVQANTIEAACALIAAQKTLIEAFKDEMREVA